MRTQLQEQSAAYKEQLARVEREKEELKNYKEEEVASFKVSLLYVVNAVFQIENTLNERKSILYFLRVLLKGGEMLPLEFETRFQKRACGLSFGGRLGKVAHVATGDPSRPVRNSVSVA